MDKRARFVLGYMSRERGDNGRFVETVTLDDVRALLREMNEPVTGTEVGNHLGISNRAALDKLNRLHDQGIIRRKQVGARSVIWWLPHEETPTPEIDPDDPLFTGDAIFATEESFDETEIDDVLYGKVDS